MDAEELLIFLMNHSWCMYCCGLLMLACFSVVTVALLYLPVAAAALLYLPVAAAVALLYLPLAAAAGVARVGAAVADTLHCPADMTD